MSDIEKTQLQQANTRLMQLIASLEGGVLVEDQHRTISVVNQAFCDMFGIDASPATLTGIDCSGSAEANKALFAEPDAFVSRIEAILADRTIVTGDMLRLADGRVFSRDYIPVFDSDNLIGHLWHYRDVTEATLAQIRMERLLRFETVNKEINRLFLQMEDIDDALNRSLAITGQLLDVSRAYVFRIREHERVLDNTHEWCAPGVKPEIDNLKGLPFDELFPSFFPMMADHDLIAPSHIRELPDDLRGILEPQDIETVIWLPMYLDGRIEGFIGYDEIRNPRTWLPEEITTARIVMESYARALEREIASQMLIEAHDEAVRTARIRTQFVANMSHEIRTPVTGIQGMLELLLETNLDDLQHEFASEALNSSIRMLAIVNDILDFSKLEAGQIVLDADPIDLHAIATEVKTTFFPQLKGKPIEFCLDLDPNIPYRVYGDTTRIRQILMNLVGNAVKFTHQGSVTLSIHVISHSEGTVCLRFSVRDSGIGIPQESIERIFESFVQADGTTTRRYGGSGLGLSISKQLVELMGSSIEVESDPKTGSTFSFVLRLSVAQETRSSGPMNPDFAGLNVLVIDNNRTARYVLVQQLESWGVHVSQASEADSAQVLLLENRFDLIFQRWSSMNFASASQAAATCPVIYITDSDAVIDHDERSLLRWPINQSRLYNLLAEVALAHSPRIPPSTENQTESARVLLADDLPVNVDLVRYALEEARIRVDAVENGQQLLEQLEKDCYDLILMDVQMPVMDGIEATRRIRQSGAVFRDIPILALTASVMPEERDRYQAAGIDAIISKPFSIKHLREIVSQWIKMKRSATPGSDTS